MQLVGTIVQLCPAIHIQHRRTKTFDVVLQYTDDFTTFVIQLFHDTTDIVGTDVHVPIVPELDVDVQLILYQTESTFLQNLHDLIRFEVPDVHGRTKDAKDTKNRFPDIVLLRQEQDRGTFVHILMLMTLVVQFDHLHKIQQQTRFETTRSANEVVHTAVLKSTTQHRVHTLHTGFPILTLRQQPIPCFGHHRIEMGCIRQIKPVVLLGSPLRFHELVQDRLEHLDRIGTILRMFPELVRFQIFQQTDQTVPISMQEHDVQLRKDHVVDELNVFLLQCIGFDGIENVSLDDFPILVIDTLAHIPQAHLPRDNATDDPCFQIQPDELIPSHLRIVGHQQLRVHPANVLLQIGQVCKVDILA